VQEDLLMLATSSGGYIPGIPGYVSSGLTLNILLILISVWVIGFLICQCYLNLKSALTVVTLKTAVVLIYFLYFANGQWFTGGDDWGYVLGAMDLSINDVNPLKIWFVQEGHNLHQFANSALPKWYNLSLFYLFTPSYYVGVFFFTTISIISGGFIYLLLVRTGKEANVAQLGTIFYLLHWETITWTSFLNLKEPLVTLFLVITIYCFSILPTQSIRSLIGLTITSFVYQKLRYYIPFLLFTSFITTLLLTGEQFRNKRNYIWTVLIVVVFSGTLLVADIVKISQIKYGFLLADWTYFPYGLIKVILSPLPWRITEPASYLYVSSILHIVLLPITLLGGYLLWTKGYVGRLIVITYIVGLVAYAFQPLVNSPRHRAPFMALEILMQLEFFYWAFRPRGNLELTKKINTLFTKFLPLR